MSILFVFALASDTASAQSESSGESLDRPPVVLGLNGAWKLGHPISATVELDAELAERASAIAIGSVDGDGVEVTYRQQLAAGDSTSEASQYRIPIRIGRQNVDLQVAVLAEDGAELARWTVPTSGNGLRPLSSDQTLVVCIGSTMGVEKLSRRSAAGGEPRFSTVLLDDVAQLPDHWNDYTCCDVIAFSTADIAMLQAMRPEQWGAIVSWIRRGGACVLSLDDDFGRTDVAGLTELKEMLPGKIVGAGTVSDPGLLETLVITEQPLGRFPVAILEQSQGQAEVLLTDRLQRDLPWWVSYAYGMGTIQMVASDLDEAAFVDWGDRKLLWARLLTPYIERDILEGLQSEAQADDSSYLGYNDLTGQLRATLDVFGSVRVVTFGEVAALLIAVMVLVGPVDYFVAVRWLKRPDLSWYLSGLVLVGSAVGLTLLYVNLRPNEVRVNTAQIIDVDTKNGHVDGQLWSHIYCGKAQRINLSLETADGIGDAVLDWQGLPGNGLGGLRSQLTTDRGIPAYEIVTDGNGTRHVSSVGIPAAGTKCVTAGWNGTFAMNGTSTLAEIPGVDQLTGDVVNPLSVDLRDAMLFYHKWFYRLNSRIPAGGTLAISLDTIPKDISRRLNGRRDVDGTDTITPWNPSDRNSLDRLLELMMFHQAASGKAYTKLNHRYQPLIDHSNLLQRKTDQAILVGWLDEAPSSLTVETIDQQDAEVIQDVNRTFCRLIIPVEQQKKKR